MLQNSALIPNREFTFPIRYEGTVLVPSYLIGISLSLLGMKASRKSLLGAFIPNRDFTFHIRYEGTVLVPSYLIGIYLRRFFLMISIDFHWLSMIFRPPGNYYKLRIGFFH